MLYAIWLVCILGSPCQLIEEDKPVFFKDADKCYAHAENTAKEFAEQLTQRRIPASIKFTCKEATEV